MTPYEMMLQRMRGQKAKQESQQNSMQNFIRNTFKPMLALHTPEQLKQLENNLPNILANSYNIRSLGSASKAETGPIRTIQVAPVEGKAVRKPDPKKRSTRQKDPENQFNLIGRVKSTLSPARRVAGLMQAMDRSHLKDLVNRAESAVPNSLRDPKERLFFIKDYIDGERQKLFDENKGVRHRESSFLTEHKDNLSTSESDSLLGIGRQHLGGLSGVHDNDYVRKTNRTSRGQEKDVSTLEDMGFSVAKEKLSDFEKGIIKGLLTEGYTAKDIVSIIDSDMVYALEKQFKDSERASRESGPVTVRTAEEMKNDPTQLESKAYREHMAKLYGPNWFTPEVHYAGRSRSIGGPGSGGNHLMGTTEYDKHMQLQNAGKIKEVDLSDLNKVKEDLETLDEFESKSKLADELQKAKNIIAKANKDKLLSKEDADIAKHNKYTEVNPLPSEYAAGTTQFTEEALDNIRKLQKPMHPKPEEGKKLNNSSDSYSKELKQAIKLLKKHKEFEPKPEDSSYGETVNVPGPSPTKAQPEETPNYSESKLGYDPELYQLEMVRTRSPEGTETVIEAEVAPTFAAAKAAERDQKKAKAAVYQQAIAKEQASRDREFVAQEKARKVVEKNYRPQEVELANREYASYSKGNSIPQTTAEKMPWITDKNYKYGADPEDYTGRDSVTDDEKAAANADRYQAEVSEFLETPEGQEVIFNKVEPIEDPDGSLAKAEARERAINNTLALSNEELISNYERNKKVADARRIKRQVAREQEKAKKPARVKKQSEAVKKRKMSKEEFDSEVTKKAKAGEVVAKENVDKARKAVQAEQTGPKTLSAKQVQELKQLKKKLEKEQKKNKDKDKDKDK